jgi:hypothetical protein
MARILYSSMVTELKGSIGGLTFHRNAAGTIARLKPSRQQVANEMQSGKQVIFSQAIKAWSSLSHDDQVDWNAAAAAAPKLNYWNEAKAVTGFNLFTSFYINAITVGGTPRTSAPTLSTPLAVPTFGSTFSSSTFNIVFSPPFAHTAAYLLVYASPPIMSVGVKNRKLLRLIQVIAPGTTGIDSIFAAWCAAFGYTSMPATGTRGYFIQLSIATIHSTYFFNSPFTSLNDEILF